MNAVMSLPRIVRFLETIEGGSCPHCGADGRWIHRFVTDDGNQRGAMSGCVKLFPVSRVALEEQRLRKKEESLRKRFGESAHLNRNDTRAMEAIEAFYRGEMQESSCLSVVKGAKMANSARYRGRR